MVSAKERIPNSFICFGACDLASSDSRWEWNHGVTHQGKGWLLRASGASSGRMDGWVGGRLGRGRAPPKFVIMQVRCFSMLLSPVIKEYPVGQGATSMYNST